MPHPETAEKIMTEAEAANFLGMTPRFLQSRRYKQNGPRYIRISDRCIKYRLTDLLAWLNSQCRGGVKTQHSSRSEPQASTGPKEQPQCSKIGS